MQARHRGDIAACSPRPNATYGEVIHGFNVHGVALDPRSSGGPPVQFGPAAYALICRAARPTPAGLG